MQQDLVCLICVQFRHEIDLGDVLFSRAEVEVDDLTKDLGLVSDHCSCYRQDL